MSADPILYHLRRMVSYFWEEQSVRLSHLLSLLLTFDTESCLQTFMHDSGCGSSGYNILVDVLVVQVAMTVAAKAVVLLVAVVEVGFVMV